MKEFRKSSHNMPLQFAFQFLLLLSSMTKTDSNQSIDSILGMRYQFELFEYFEGCAEIYNQESKVVPRLMEIKARLHRFKQNIQGVQDQKCQM